MVVVPPGVPTPDLVGREEFTLRGGGGGTARVEAARVNIKKNVIVFLQPKTSKL